MREFTKEPGRANELLLLDGGDNYVSYNHDTSQDNGPFKRVVDLLGAVLGAERSDGEETALCFDGEWYILTGDFRKEYAAIVNDGGDGPECLAFFRSKPEFRNVNSTGE